MMTVCCAAPSEWYSRVVAMSGGGQTGQIDMLKAAAAFGAARTLLKPFEPRELLTAIRELLGARAPS